MTAEHARRGVTALICAPIVAALPVACGNDSSSTSPLAAAPADCVNVVEESGNKTDECLPVAADSERVDLATPSFGKPTPITNPLHPTTEVTQVVMGGHVDDKPFRTEVSLLPGTKPIQWRGRTVDTAIIQYVAYLDGRIHEVALDWYAQADDGSVWYFGEDVFNYEDGRVADTKGTWMANETTPPAMIMPTTPIVGNVYRPENAPEIVFEEVRVEKVDQTVPGPSGSVSGAIEVMELHMDGTREHKVFAPGYGEFSTGNPGGDLEAVSLASPTDRRQSAAPGEFAAMSTAADAAYQAAAGNAADRLTQTTAALESAWAALLPNGIPPQMEQQMTADIDALKSAAAAGDSASTQSAALRVAQNELDLRLMYEPVINVDLARLSLWTRQLPIDVAAEDLGLVLADIAALERVWERTRHAVHPTAPVDAAIQMLRQGAAAADLPAVNRSATSLNQAVGPLRAS